MSDPKNWGLLSILKNLALMGLVDPENRGLLSNCNQKLRTASVRSFMCFLSFDHLTSVREVCLFSFDGISWWWPARLLMCRIVEILWRLVHLYGEHKLGWFMSFKVLYWTQFYFKSSLVNSPLASFLLNFCLIHTTHGSTNGWNHQLLALIWFKINMLPAPD
jgi:hypothetical protein